ncbi:hypothetical protein WJX79_009688 [Trebouxia sp. C0005]
MPTEDKQKDVAVTENAVQGAIDQGQHQWLDSKLAQAVPKQSLMLPSPPIRKTLPDENSLAIQGVSAPDGQHPASEAGSSQWAVSCTEAHSQWLDAALAGKKLAAVKAPTAGAATEPKKSSSPSVPVVGTAVMKESPNGNQAHNLKTAGTSDMLAWLDAKIAAQKASIVG